ncbi:MAG: transposase, partial [Nitrososphaerota archaeon]|nr:transposase [Nitrososphaerota archaeon]
NGYGKCVFHIVLVSTFRCELFVNFGIKSCCETVLRGTAYRLGCDVFVLQVGDDHVHVFVGLHPDCSVFKLINLLKCNSAIDNCFWRFLR